MYFNLIKFAQRQGLLYYPFNKPFDQVKQQAQPIGVNKEKDPIYKCHDCGKPVTEDEIEFWYSPTDTSNQYSLSINITENDVRDFSSAIKDIVDTYLLELNKENYDIENLKNIISNKIKILPHINEIYNLAQITGSQFGRPNYLYVVNLLKQFVERGDTDLLFRVSQISTQSIEDGLYSDIEEASNFETSVSQPVCEDCADNYPECSICEKHIPPDERVSQMVDGDYICDECLDSGDFGYCSECGLIDHVDEMHWVEAHEAEYCDNCYKNLKIDYDDYEQEIEDAAEGKEYPFKDWFNNDSNRIYLDFNPNMTLSDSDDKVVEFLRSYRCQVSTDEYIKGYCILNGRTFKIGKLLDKIRSDEIKKLRKSSQDPDQIKQESEYINSTIENLKNMFINSVNRRSGKKSELNVVISQDIHDIGKMSTGRDWTSCMQLGVGSYHQNVFCEVKEGGLIAYLITADDKDIEHPLARISIKRFVNDSGQSLALPENTVYGNAPSGFLKQVKDWLDSRQGHLPKGRYTRKGGEYSDSYGMNYELAFTHICKLIKTACGNSNWYSLMDDARKLINFLGIK